MTHGKTTQMNRTTAESSHLVAMISRGRATHHPTLTVKITGRYRAVDGLAQPHRKPSTHLPQIDRLMRTVRRGKRNVNCSNESSAVRALVPAVAQLAHDDRLRRRAERRRARTRSDSIVKNSAERK